MAKFYHNHFTSVSCIERLKYFQFFLAYKLILQLATKMGYFRSQVTMAYLHMILMISFLIIRHYLVQYNSDNSWLHIGVNGKRNLGFWPDARGNPTIFLVFYLEGDGAIGTLKVEWLFKKMRFLQLLGGVPRNSSGVSSSLTIY